jgi:hypothetical protein
MKKSEFIKLNFKFEISNFCANVKVKITSLRTAVRQLANTLTMREFSKWILVYLTSSCVNWVPKRAQFTHERVEYNVFFLFDKPLKCSKLPKIFKINLTFHFGKLWHLSKSIQPGENSQILTVSNKKLIF